MKFTFPKPPPLNHLYGTNKWGGKYLKRDGKMWQKAAIWSTRSTPKENWKKPLSFTVHLYTCRHQDNDSILKLLQDTLQLAQVYEDDFWIFELHVFKHKSTKKEERVEVEIIPLSQQETS